MFEPKATAPHLDSTKLRRTQYEQMSSALRPIADIREMSWRVRQMPDSDIVIGSAQVFAGQ